MDINIQGNPGTGNTFQEIKIEHVENFNSNAQVVNNYYGSQPQANSEGAVVDKATIRKAILEDVSKLLNMVYKSRQTVWMNLWNDIIDLREVKIDVYMPGKNKDMIYNRKLVAAIIHFVGSDENNCLGWISHYNASDIAATLLGSSQKSIRGELGAQPSDEVQNAIRELINEKYLNLEH